MVPQKFWIICKPCADELGYEEDAPKFATERGLERHLILVHNGRKNTAHETFKFVEG